MKCLSCDVYLDARRGANCADDADPDGAISICAHCGNVTVITSEGELRYPTPDEYPIVCRELAQLYISTVLRQNAAAPCAPADEPPHFGAGQKIVH